ncbi:MAG: hypothetical protein U5K56_20000 [Halioglobus sp.]|nr:hypothetical protein [Halioglobus sp.]
MFQFAQTNLQLYRQLHARGYGEGDIAQLRHTYEIALPLFSGQYRSSDKPFITHLVGTTSILASNGERAAVLSASMLHAAYMRGDFGFDAGSRRSRRRRAWLSDRLGREVENLVARYDAEPWNRETIRAWCADREAVGPAERDLLRMLLANVYEDFMDGGMCRGISRKSLLYTDTGVQRDILHLAARCRWPELATLLAAAFQEFNAARKDLPEDGGQGISTLRLPPSARRKLLPTARGWFARRLRRRFAMRREI